jgi:hypothetical protein
MDQVCLDPRTSSQLCGATSAVKLLDDQGHLIGHFLPPEQYRRLLYEWANAQITDEELQRRLEVPGGSTLAEIWAKLARSP